MTSSCPSSVWLLMGSISNAGKYSQPCTVPFYVRRLFPWIYCSVWVVFHDFLNVFTIWQKSTGEEVFVDDRFFVILWQARVAVAMVPYCVKHDGVVRRRSEPCGCILNQIEDTCYWRLFPLIKRSSTHARCEILRYDVLSLSEWMAGAHFY